MVITSTLTFSAANKNAISIADVNAGSTVEPLSLTATDGTLTLGTTTGITFASGSNGSASMTLKGTLANLNAALSGLTFSPASVGAATVVLAYTDVGNGLMGTATIDITVSKGATKGGLGPAVSLATPVAAPGASVSGSTEGDALSANGALDSPAGSAAGAITIGSAPAVGSPVSNSAVSNSPAATTSTDTPTAMPPDEEANQWAGVTPAVEALIG